MARKSWLAITVTLGSATLALVGCGATNGETYRADQLASDIKGSTTAKNPTPEVPKAPPETRREQTRREQTRREQTRREQTSVGLVAAALEEPPRSACRSGMVAVEGSYCIDRYEASLVEVLPSGEERPFSPFTSVRHQHVRAVSEPNVVPQGYISATQASQACVASGKRLCKVNEWQQACRGPENKRYGYAEERQVGRCNDNGKNPVMSLFGPRYDASTMNQPQLNQMEGTLAKTGEHPGCSNGYGVYDMVGNLHEWVADPNGTFFGGYYQDVSSVGHGEGCGYQTKVHEARYHDYSTGFRCCADLLGSEGTSAPPPPIEKPSKARPNRGRPRRR